MPSSSFTFRSDHPVFAGHFPGRPIVPGVMLMDWAQTVIETHMKLRLDAMPEAKFHSVATPTDTLQLKFEADRAAVRFEILSASRKIASGRFSLPAVATT